MRRPLFYFNFCLRGCVFMRKETALKQAEPGFMKRFGFYIALAVLAVIVLLPTPEGLSVAGLLFWLLLCFFPRRKACR